jgi:hypothetical protein
MIRIDFSTVNAAALSALASLVRLWLPDGHLEGAEWIALNPTRADRRTGSFKVNIHRGVWCDWSTGDAGNDPVSLFAYLNSLGQAAAARELAAMLGVDGTVGQHSSWSRPVRPAERPPEPPEPDQRGLNLWREATPYDGSFAEQYLRGRAIIVDPGPVARCHPRLPIWITPEDGRRAYILDEVPGLVMGFTWKDDAKVRGVHRIFLGPDAKKLQIPDPDHPGQFLDSKKALGRFKGCAIRFGAPPERDLVLAEGPENALSLYQVLGLPVWSSISSSNMPNVVIPDHVERVTLAGDNGAAGHTAVEKARARYLSQGLKVRTVFPPGSKDWNDCLREGAAIGECHDQEC